MSPTAGGEGSLARGTSKSVAAAAASQGPLKRYPSKRNAKKEAAAAIGPHGSSKGRSTKRKAAKDPASGRMPRRHASGRKSKADEASAGGSGGAVAQKKRLSKGEIDLVLSWKPLVPPSSIADLKRSNPSLVPRPEEEADEDRMRIYRLARSFDKMEERRPRLQAWVRSELGSKGYVELDDESVRRRAAAQAVVDREWPEIEAKMSALILSEKEYQREYYQRAYGGGEEGLESDSDDDEDGGESDSDEGEDDEEDQVN